MQMTPSQLFKLNLKHYKLVLFVILICLSLGAIFSNLYGFKINNKYELLIVEDINTKFLIDELYKREGLNNDDYYKYLKNYSISKFINSKYNKYGAIDINKKGEYFIVASFGANNENEIDKFENNLTKFLNEIQIKINDQITQNFQFRIGKSSVGIKADSKIFYKKKSTKKGNDPFSIYLASLLFGIIISSFIIILENPPKK